MLERDYTVLYTNYNKWDILKLSQQSLEQQTIKPIKYYIMNDGSTDNRNIDVTPNTDIINFKHTGNLCKMINDTVDMVETEKFIIFDPDFIFPLRFMETLLMATDPHNIVIPIFILVSSLNNLPTLANGYSQLTVDDQPIAFPQGPFISYKSTFLYYNESYSGSYFDTDYLQRWRLNGYRILRSNYIYYYHLDHERKSDIHDQERVEKNKELYRRLLPYYYNNNNIYNLKNNRSLEPK